MSKVHVLIAMVLGIIVLGAGLAVQPTYAAFGADCSASPSTVVVGGVIHIECVGFDPNVYVNSYVVDATGFSEVGRYSYSVCLIGANSNVPASAKANEGGTATFTWYTQDGKNSCPNGNYDGFANGLGTYTVVMQELDGKGGIKTLGTVVVTITGNGETYSGAILETDGPGVSGGTLTVYGSGFAPNEYVNLWFTRPGECSGLGDWYYVRVSAFSPTSWSGGGVSGNDSVKADSSGSFVSSYLLHDFYGNAYPCIGTWHVTANAPASDRGAEAAFVINGKSVTENAQVWTTEDRVSSINQSETTGGSGVGVHVNGSGFPAGAPINCWFTRPDGTVYRGAVSTSYFVPFTAHASAGGTFSGLTLTGSSDPGYQGEQPGTWAVTCGTPDGKYVGIAHFVVYPLPLIDP